MVCMVVVEKRDDVENIKMVILRVSNLLSRLLMLG